MSFVDYLIIGIIAAIGGAAVYYIRRAKKQGKKCIGCPDSGSCGGCSCGCGRQQD